MNLNEIKHYIASLPDVTAAENFGYHFFFYSTDQVLPFATLAESDNEYDSISNLNRDGIFRVNIGVSKDSYKKLFQKENQEWDYTELNRFMPHPQYAAQNFICVLNPSAGNSLQTMQYIKEAYDIAKGRFERKQKNG